MHHIPDPDTHHPVLKVCIAQHDDHLHDSGAQRSDSSAADSQSRESQKPEDQQRIHGNIYDQRDAVDKGSNQYPLDASHDI